MQQYYLEKMGITSWVLRHDQQVSTSLQCLAQTVAACTRCPLHTSRSQTVFARGNPQAKLMLIGEAPGFHEDQQGLPFVGAAGQLLNKMLGCIGFDSNQVYIANILKCRPPNNRDPHPDEIAQCSPFLAQQITIIQPSLILALGRFAGQYLLQTTQSLHSMRGRIHTYQQIPVMVTYHPAYLLRNPADKKKAYQDWLTLQQFFNA